MAFSRTLTIISGNSLKSGYSKLTPSEQGQDESLLHSLDETIAYFLASTNSISHSKLDNLFIINSPKIQRFSSHEIISLKLVIYSFPFSFDEIYSILVECFGLLDYAKFSIIITCPSLVEFPNNSDIFSNFLTVYENLLLLKERRLVHEVGVADFSGDLLRKMYHVSNALDIVQINFSLRSKDSSNENSLNDLLELCKQYNLKVLTHGDSSDLLSPHMLRALLRKHGMLEDNLRQPGESQKFSRDIKLRWISILGSVDEERSISLNQSYFLRAVDK